MDLAALITSALGGNAAAHTEVERAPAPEWTTQAANIAPVFAQFLERNPKWPQVAPLARLAKLPVMPDFIRLLIEPGSEHTELGVKLATFGRPSDELEERLRELEPTDDVKRALATVSGAGVVDDLAHWMGRAFVSQDVLDGMAAPLSALATLAPRQLARSAPRLIDLLENWLSVTGGDDALEVVYRALDRAHVPTLIKTLEPLVAKDRHRWLERLKDIYFRWPNGARWANEAVEFFEPSEDDDDGWNEEDPPPQPVQAFRRQR